MLKEKGARRNKMCEGDNNERLYEIINQVKEDNFPPFSPYAIASAASQADPDGDQTGGKVFSFNNRESPNTHERFPVSWPTCKDIE